MEVGSQSETESTEAKQQEYLQRFLAAASKLEKKYIPREKYDQASKKLANILHQNWVDGYKANPKNYDSNGELKPRWRVAEDEEWLAIARSSESEYHRHYRKNPDTLKEEVDIAALTNEQLPLNRRQENEEAAAFAVGQIKDAKSGPGDYLDEGFLVGASHEVHEAWKKRNTWAHDNKELMKPYRDLTLDEKLKDQEHIVLAAELVAG
jgi:hypothetical protein